jgi:hypothetical protein
MSTSPPQIGREEEWYLYLPNDAKIPPQLYRTARTVWPLSAQDVKQTEDEAAASNPSALNNLGNGPTTLAGAVCDSLGDLRRV